MSIREEYLQDLVFQDDDHQTHVFNGNREVVLSDTDDDDEEDNITTQTLDIYSVITVLDNMRQHCDIMGLNWLNSPKSMEGLLELLDSEL